MPGEEKEESAMDQPERHDRFLTAFYIERKRDGLSIGERTPYFDD